MTVYEVAADLEMVIADAAGRVEIGELPVIDADPSEMRRLLQNLIANSLKYRHADRRPVVRVRSSSPDDARRATIVADNGIGFDPEYTQRISRCLNGLHGRARSNDSGNDLAICRRIAERHGGTITATSSPGQGTTFAVTLPLSQPTPGLCE